MMNSFGFLACLNAVDGEAAATMPTGSGFSMFAAELPRWVTPTVAGLTVGAFVGVFGFIAVLLLVGRGNRRSPRRRAAIAADEVVCIPPYSAYPAYTAMQRDTPLPPQAFATPGYTPFAPSTELSARAFGAMDQHDSADADPSVFFEVDTLDEDDLVESHTPPRGSAAVTVAPVVVISAPPPAVEAEAVESGEVRAADKSAPHPLGIIKSSSAAMRAAPISALAFDDSPTEIGETYFDEPPQPRRRTDPPKIRPVTPAGPRFPMLSPALPDVASPRARIASGARSESTGS